jgi:hypothetical protein
LRGTLLCCVPARAGGGGVARDLGLTSAPAAATVLKRPLPPTRTHRSFGPTSIFYICLFELIYYMIWIVVEII